MIPVVFLSGDSFNRGMARSRGVPFYNAKEISNQLDKEVAIEKICEIYKVNKEDVAYVGDDYYDLSLLANLRWSFCPKDAAQIVKSNVKYVLNRNGGDGVVELLYEAFKDKIVQRYPYET
jgi:3-deoxy-D-manno-octulosonate 8-phosphate phosphatase KdsC-like HAD superfamily phosphatase